MRRTWVGCCPTPLPEHEANLPMTPADGIERRIHSPGNRNAQETLIVDNNTIALNHKKVSRSQRCPIPTNQRVEEFEKAHACIADIITDPLTGVCYVKCAAGGKEIDISKRYLVDDQVTIDDITFTKNPDIARRWLISGKNVGVYTGIAPKEVVEDNVIILDIDLRDVAPDEEPGFMAPKDVIDRVVGRTLTIETRSGGLQCIFHNAIGATGSPKLRYVDPETGYLKDAGDTRIKHAYALFAGSYVAPDKVTSKVNPDDPLKPVKKALPHADGLYRAIHVCPVIDLTQEFLNEAGLAIGGNKARAPRNIASSDGSVIRKIDPAKVQQLRASAVQLQPDSGADRGSQGKRGSGSHSKQGR